MNAILALLVLSQSPNTDAEIFLDRGETYIRAGQLNGLEVGAALEVLDAKSRQPVGTAAVMEVWESLSRVSLDSKSVAYAPLKVARVGKRAEVVALPVPQVQAQPQPQAADPLGPVPPVNSKPVPAGEKGMWLDGQVKITGVSEGRRVVIKNRSNRDWHNCDVRLPNGKHYYIGNLDEGEDDGVMLFRFEYERGVAPPPPTEGITVLCREGTGRFPISL